MDIIDKEGISIEGWPLSLEDNRFYSSPILFDLNKDGNVDIITVDDCGIIRVVNVSHTNSFVIHSSLKSNYSIILQSFHYQLYRLIVIGTKINKS